MEKGLFELLVLPIIALIGSVFFSVAIISLFYYPLRLFLTGTTTIENVSNIDKSYEVVGGSPESASKKQVTIVHTKQSHTKFIIYRANDTTLKINQPVYIV